MGLTDIKNDYAILAMYSNGNEYVIYDNLTYDEATEKLALAQWHNTENVLYMISDGVGDLPKLERDN